MICTTDTSLKTVWDTLVCNTVSSLQNLSVPQRVLHPIECIEQARTVSSRPMVWSSFSSTKCLGASQLYPLDGMVVWFMLTPAFSRSSQQSAVPISSPGCGERGKYLSTETTQHDPLMCKKSHWRSHALNTPAPRFSQTEEITPETTCNCPFARKINNLSVKHLRLYQSNVFSVS